MGRGGGGRSGEGHIVAHSGQRKGRQWGVNRREAATKSVRVMGEGGRGEGEPDDEVQCSQLPQLHDACMQKATQAATSAAAWQSARLV